MSMLMQMLWYDNGLSISFNTALVVTNGQWLSGAHDNQYLGAGHRYLDPLELPVAETIHPIHTTTPDQEEYEGYQDPDDPFNTGEVQGEPW